MYKTELEPVYKEGGNWNLEFKTMFAPMINIIVGSFSKIDFNKGIIPIYVESDIDNLKDIYNEIDRRKIIDELLERIINAIFNLRNYNSKELQEQYKLLIEDYKKEEIEELQQQVYLIAILGGNFKEDKQYIEDKLNELKGRV